MGYWVYLLRSRKDGQFYIGQTDNLERRVLQHNTGKVRSTRTRMPFDLIGAEAHETREQARFREYDLKHHSDKKRAFIVQLTSKRP